MTTPAARLRLSLYSTFLDFRALPPFFSLSGSSGDTHRCDSSCPWFERPPFYFCRKSGNLHLCSERLCDRLVQTHDALVCPITATAYALPYNESAYSDNVDYARREAGGDNLDGAAEYELGDTEAALPADGIASMDCTESLVDELFEPAEQPSAPAVPVPKKRAKRKERKPRSACLSSELTGYEQKRIYSTVIRNVYELNNSEPPSPEVIDYYVTLCCRLWRLIVGSSHFVAYSFSYHVEYHALVVLYNFRGGFEFNTLRNNTRVCLIEPREDIHKHLPVIGTLAGRYIAATTVAIRTSRYTSAERFFRDAIMSATYQQLRAYITEQNVRRKPCFCGPRMHAQEVCLCIRRTS